MIRKIFRVVIVALSIFALSSLSVAFGEAITFDYSGDFFSYAQMVALLNQEQQMLQISSFDDKGAVEATELIALLCKTDGREIDFSHFFPRYIVYGPDNCLTLFFDSTEALDNAISELNHTEGILYAEADCEVHANSLESSEEDGSTISFHSWGASQMKLDRYLSYVDFWGNGSASVAVIDSGVFPHSLIKAKLLSSGYDYVDGDDDSFNDLFGHGTNVAGIIADCTVDEPVYIYSIRVLGSSGNGKMSNVVNAVREAKAKGVTIINLSLESSVMSEALDDAILEAVSSGIIVVVAAGNSSCNTSEVCPAHLTNSGVIVVGSAEGSNGSYSRASYSNYGSSVDIYAFGTNISCCSRSGGFSSETGTSMAAPHVSALCALMHLIHPGLSPGQAERRLRIAALGSDPIIVTDSSLMIPDTEGFRLALLKMSIGDSFSLPVQAFPSTSLESIKYSSSDEHVVVCKDGILIAQEMGTAYVAVSCKGFEDQSIQVVVDDAATEATILPAMLQIIESEAFYGASSLTHVTIPDTVFEIGDNAFEDCTSLKTIRIPVSVIEIGSNTFSDAVILCDLGSTIYDYAFEQGLQYVILN